MSPCIHLWAHQCLCLCRRISLVLPSSCLSEYTISLVLILVQNLRQSRIEHQPLPNRFDRRTQRFYAYRRLRPTRTQISCRFQDLVHRTVVEIHHHRRHLQWRKTCSTQCQMHKHKLPGYYSWLDADTRNITQFTQYYLRAFICSMIICTTTCLPRRTSRLCRVKKASQLITCLNMSYRANRTMGP